MKQKFFFTGLGLLGLGVAWFFGVQGGLRAQDQLMLFSDARQGFNEAVTPQNEDLSPGTHWDCVFIEPFGFNQKYSSTVFSNGLPAEIHYLQFEVLSSGQILNNGTAPFKEFTIPDQSVTSEDHPLARIDALASTNSEGQTLLLRAFEGHLIGELLKPGLPEDGAIRSQVETQRAIQSLMECSPAK